MKPNKIMLTSSIVLALAGSQIAYSGIETQQQEQLQKTVDNSFKAEQEMVAYYVRYAKGKKSNLTASLRSSNFRVNHELDRYDTLAVSFPKGQESLLSNMDGVEFMEPVPVHRPMAQVTPWNIDQFQARDVWDTDRDGIVDDGAPTGAGVKFCIIDTGFYAAHDDFQGINHTGMSQIAGEAYTEDGNGHGTHVAGTANAMNNDIGVVGVMPGGADLHIIKIFNNAGVWSQGESNLGAAATACKDAGANAISMSLGGGNSATEEAIFQDLYDNFNIVNIAAAGNDGNNVASFPASYDSVISVAALEQSEAWASFSQFPDTSYDPNTPPADVEWDVVELSGGGANVLSTWPGPPHSNVPVILVSNDGVDYTATQIAETAAGDVTEDLVDGGLCDAGDINQAWDGKVVLCERGDITFADKMNNVADTGGVGVVLFNNEAGTLNATCGGNCTSGAALPGVAITQTEGQFLKANGLGLPTQVLVDDGVSSCNGCTGGYNSISGTSMATPGVAAGIAWAWAACGGPSGITNKDLRQLLRDSAKDLTGANYGAGWDTRTGFGLVQLADALALGNQRFGSTCPIGLSVAPSTIEVCTMDNPSDAVFTVTLSDDFNGTSNMTSTGVPAGASGAYSLNPVVSPTDTTDFTVSGLAGLASGTATMTLTATDANDANNTQSSDVTLVTVDAAPGAMSLTMPSDAAVDVISMPTFTWSASAQVATYAIEIATDAGFTNVVDSATGLTAESYTVSTALDSSTTYYWRVTATNLCGTEVASVSSFTTGTEVCSIYTSSDVPKAIDLSPAPGAVTSVLNVADSGIISDVNVVDLSGTHTWIADLVISVESPSTTAVSLMTNVCNSEDNFDLNFDDQAASAQLPCPPADGGTYQPATALSALIGEEMNGTWTLTVDDSIDADGGSLDTWGLEICYPGTPEPSDVIFKHGFDQ
ncbi:S8 family serine peptidase [Marinicella rhabdoformis]|uniref:S8 family serine peptidase n=1 Tax=Marinicella rhabdoformis TaxID=2580566 RepID=UPI0012AEDB17|nr:S8 family serine peptidase [Marinicella rhabdoformis]